MTWSSSHPVSTSPLTKVLVMGVLVSAGGALAAVLSGASVYIPAVALVSAAVCAVSAAVHEHRRAPNSSPFNRRSPFENLKPSSVPPNREAWVRIATAAATRLKVMFWVGYAAPFILPLPWLWLRPQFLTPSLAAKTAALVRFMDLMMGLVALSFLLLAIFLGRDVKRTLRSRIGANRTHLLYDPGTGTIERYAWSSVLTDKSQLLIGRRVIPLVRPAFPVEDLRTLVLAHLPQTSFVGHARLQWTALRRGNPALWSTLAALIAMTVPPLLGLLHPDGLNAARDAFVAWLTASVS